MRTASLTLLLLLLPALPAHAQQTEPPNGTRIADAQVSGLDLDRLSPGLREEIDRLAGTPLDRTRLRELADRIELEEPRYVAAIRTGVDAAGEARVTFVVARVLDEASEANVNARYIVEAARLEGAAEAELRVPPKLRADLQALVGKPLDGDAADRLEARLRDALLPDYSVARRSRRGSQPGRIVLIFRIERSEAASWLRTEPLDAHGVYHSDQGWSANLPLTLSGRFLSINPIVTISDTEDRIEESSGFALRIESRRVGTERLGAVFEWSTLRETWRSATLDALAANPSLPAAYRHRSNVAPLVKFAVTPRFTVGGGVSITQLDPLDGATDMESRMANAAVGFMRYHQAWGPPGASWRRAFDAGLTLRSGVDWLQSDLDYTRVLGEASYVQGWGRQRVFLSATGGGTSGDTPLFERFSLGDTRTLRGWDKFDIAPAGGSRMYHASAEYTYRGAGLFLDAGSVWNGGESARHRFSAGITYNPGPVFVTVGFPLNTGQVHAVFAMGFRWSTVASVRRY